MMKDGGQRIATSSGAMLADPGSLGNVTPRVFEPAFWAERGELRDVVRGRGSAWFVSSSPHEWALRHYRRGGFIARFSKDLYVWTGEKRVRAFAEWRLLAALTQLGLPVPRPIAARYQRAGFFYRCDLLTQRIQDAEPLSEVMVRGPLEALKWRAIGVTLGRFHASGVDHADLNAHNILIDEVGTVSVIDFDRGRLRGPGPWASRNLGRLHRSLIKTSRELALDRFPEEAWSSLLAGYGS